MKTQNTPPKNCQSTDQQTQTINATGRKSHRGHSSINRAFADAELLKFVATLAEKKLVNVSSLFKQPDAIAPNPSKKGIPGSLLNASDAASFLDLNPKTLANWRVSGAGPRFSKIGGRVVYKKSNLRAFVSANLRQSTSDKGGQNA
jgi:hypothetical protein